MTATYVIKVEVDLDARLHNTEISVYARLVGIMVLFFFSKEIVTCTHCPALSDALDSSVHTKSATATYTSTGSKSSIDVACAVCSGDINIA